MRNPMIQSLIAMGMLAAQDMGRQEDANPHDYVYARPKEALKKPKKKNTKTARAKRKAGRAKKAARKKNR